MIETLPENVWWLSACRHAIARVAPRASISFFWWSKGPGNAYTTFYPTRILRHASDPTRGDAEAGRRLMAHVVRPADSAMRLTFGSYSPGTYELPEWDGGPRPAIAQRDFPDPREAAARICDVLDIAWLEGQSPADPATTAVVLGWLDRVIERASRGPVELRMDFDRNQLPMALWFLEVRDLATGYSEDIWWPDREELEHQY